MIDRIHSQSYSSTGTALMQLSPAQVMIGKWIVEVHVLSNLDPFNNDYLQLWKTKTEPSAARSGSNARPHVFDPRPKTQTDQARPRQIKQDQDQEQIFNTKIKINTGSERLVVQWSCEHSFLVQQWSCHDVLLPLKIAFF